MRVLKFGGTSVGSPENIKKVLSIISDYQSEKVPFTVVVSAMSGVTNLLVQASKEAETGSENYVNTVKEIEEKHIQSISELIDVQHQSEAFAHVQRLINELDDLKANVSDIAKNLNNILDKKN